MIPRRNLFERCCRVMDGFVPTKEDVQKIIEMNDGLSKRLMMVYDDVVAMKKKVDSDIQNGSIRCSGYEIFPEYFFADIYEEGIPTADSEMLSEMSDKAPFFLPSLRLREDSEIPSVSDFLSIGKMNWNIESLALTGLDTHYIYYFMHSLFVDSHVFCVADIPHLKPEDLTWQITVQYEQFDR